MARYGLEGGHVKEGGEKKILLGGKDGMGVIRGDMMGIGN